MRIILPALVHPVQAGIVKGRSSTDNIRKVIAILEYAAAHQQESLAILTLDSEKKLSTTSISNSYSKRWNMWEFKEHFSRF